MLPRAAGQKPPQPVYFTQEDPIGLAGGTNLYGYAGGDPINRSDPFGLCPTSGGGDGKTDDTSDCPRGTSGWWAHRDAQGEGSSLVNNVRGFLAIFGADMRAQLPEGTLSGEFNLPIGPARSAARLTTGQAADLAKWLGFGKRVKDAPFNTMGQAVFTNGRNFITLDATMHLGTGATWKMFSRTGHRVGTYSFDLANWLGK